MVNISIDEKYIVSQAGTSEGTQVKYYMDGYWYKIDNRGCEGLAEYLVSSLLTFSSLRQDEYVLYEQCIINGKSGCRSKNFLHQNEELVTLYRLYLNEYGKNLADDILQFDTIDERIQYVIRFVKECCNIDITSYLGKVFTLDSVVLNEDRHFNNLALISTDHGFDTAPLFDHGISLLTANISINSRLPIEENIKRVVARPFSGSFSKQREYFGKSFDIDVPKALNWLKTEPDSFEKEVLVYQLRARL